LLQYTILLSMLMLHSLPCSNAAAFLLVIVALYFFDAAAVVALRLHRGVRYVDATSTADLSPACFLLFLGPDRHCHCLLHSVAVLPMLCPCHCCRQLIAAFDILPLSFAELLLLWCADVTSTALLTAAMTVLIIPVAVVNSD